MNKQISDERSERYELYLQLKEEFELFYDRELLSFNPNATIWTVDEFIDLHKGCDTTGYDLDGYGYAVKNNMVNTNHISWWNANIPKDATHIIWFGK